MKRAAYLFIILVAFACNKEDAAPKSNLELLTNNSEKWWKLQEGFIQLQQSSQLSIIGSRPTCETDNLLVLRSDNTYDLTEGATTCNVTDPNEIVKGANWNISADGKTLSVDRFVFTIFEINNAVFNITEITDTSFSGETQVEFLGSTYTGTVKFAAQN
ncbi:MAG: hypothetical protein NWP83_02390 [Spirosomaceae bacterium]|nr:hypothetical protein [Spirosomataceae bacterium]